jgi:DNA (cytosine-5)-methyltransferase 1
MNILDLFSGIGGFSLGLERAGMRTVAFCEIDPHARKVLNKHWPDVPVFTDVSTLSKDDLNEQIHIITGGFPCQDISLAGKGAGLEGARSGLWFQFHRLIKEIQPRYAIIENVSALRSRGLDVVLRGLSEIGYDAEWHCIPAAAVGARHQRDRIWIVAYPARELPHGRRTIPEQTGRREPSNSSGKVAYSVIQGWEGRVHRWADQERQSQLGYLGRCRSVDGQPIENWWSVEPSVGRVANGVSNRSHRLKQLGNAVVPQIPELIGRAIMEYERAYSLV